MSLTVYTEPTQSATLTGPLVIGKDPQTGDAGALNVSGSLAASGALNASGGLSITGGLQYDQISGGVPATTVSQAPANGSAITMTGSGRIIQVSASQSAGVSQSLTPTASSLTGTSNFANGAEVLVVNVGASSFVVPSGSGGPANTAVTISGGAAARFVYIAALQAWVLQNAK
jgi:hypothetical protein